MKDKDNQLLEEAYKHINEGSSYSEEVNDEEESVPANDEEESVPANLTELFMWLDERGFNNKYEAIDFIETSLDNEIVQKIINDVMNEYNLVTSEIEEEEGL